MKNTEAFVAPSCCCFMWRFVNFSVACRINNTQQVNLTDLKMFLLPVFVLSSVRDILSTDYTDETRDSEDAPASVSS